MARKTTAPNPAITPTASAQRIMIHAAAGSGSGKRRVGSFDCTGTLACIWLSDLRWPRHGGHAQERVVSFAREMSAEWYWASSRSSSPFPEKENERGAEQDRDDPGHVGRLIARQERRFRRFGYLARKARIALSDLS